MFDSLNSKHTDSTPAYVAREFVATRASFASVSGIEDPFPASLNIWDNNVTLVQQSVTGKQGPYRYELFIDDKLITSKPVEPGTLNSNFKTGDLYALRISEARITHDSPLSVKKVYADGTMPAQEVLRGTALYLENIDSQAMELRKASMPKVPEAGTEVEEAFRQPVGTNSSALFNFLSFGLEAGAIIQAAIFGLSHNTVPGSLCLMIALGCWGVRTWRDGAVQNSKKKQSSEEQEQ